MRELPLLYHTPKEWVDRVSTDLPKALADHANNERKASAVAMNFVVRYPDRPSLVKTASRIAEEELSHFRMVFDEMFKMGVPLLPDEKDPYAVGLMDQVSKESERRLLDRLLICSVIEMRGIERFALLSSFFPEEKWREFYESFVKSEMNHGASFLREAKKIFPIPLVESRYPELLELEAELVRNLPLTWRFH